MSEDCSEAGAAVRQTTDQHVAQLGLAPGSDRPAVVASDVVVDFVGMWAGDSGLAGGAVSGYGVFAEVKSVVEVAVAPVEGTLQRGHGGSGRCDAAVWRWALCRG